MSRKEIRQKELLQIIKDRCCIPSTGELANLLNVSERTIRNDLSEINKCIPEVAIEDIRQIVLLRLRKRAPEMKDSDLIKLAEFFMPKKTEVKTSGEVDVRVNDGREITELLQKYERIFTSKEENVSEDGT